MPKPSFRAAGEAMPAAKKITTNLHPDEMPATYAMICDGTCLEPVYSHGAKLLFSRTERYRSGDFVLLFKRPELVRPGDHQMIVKKLILAPPFGYWSDPSVNEGSNIQPIVIVEMLTPARKLYINPDHLLGIHKCLGPVPADMGTYRATDEEIKADAARRMAVAP